MIALSRPIACRALASTAQSGGMPMSPTRLRECLDVLGLGINQLARRVGGLGESSAQQMARGKRPIPDNLAAWVEIRAAVWATIPPELQNLAGQMGCDRGKFVRHPAGMRPITDEEAAQLETIATVCRALPTPVGWSAGAVQHLDALQVIPSAHA